jgi:transposase
MYDRNKIISVVDYYLRNGSLRKTAKEFNIHYNTLWKWVRKYKDGNIYGYRRPWNRKEGWIERRVIILKENYPFISLRSAREILKGEGINISIKGIWGIWKRAGLAGFKNNISSSRFTEYVSFDKRDEFLIEKAKEFIKNGRIKEGIKILNSVNFCNDGEIIKKIPDKYLSKKRVFEKYVYSIFEIPMKKYYKKMRELRKYFYKKKFYYSMMRALLQEMISLEWLSEFNKIIEISSEYLKYFEKVNDKNLKFHFLISRGIAFASLGEIKKVKEILRKCKRMSYNNSEFSLNISTLYSFIYDNKRAIKSIYKISKRDEVFYLYLSSFLLNSGKHKESMKILRGLKFDKERENLKKLAFSLYFLINGEIDKSRKYLIEALRGFKRADFKNYLFTAYLILSKIYYFLGRLEKGRRILRNIITFLKKYKLKKELSIVSILFSGKFEENFKDYPLIKMLIYLNKAKDKINYYYRAFEISKRYGIAGYFHRFVLFYPDVIKNLIKYGKNTYLPKSLLKSPLFDKERTVYYIKFLNGFSVYRNNIKVKKVLTKKERAFLIHLATRAGSPGRSINVEEICENFWNNKEKKENLYHLLFKIKAKLRMPEHSIEIERRNNFLINNKVYFITDYSEFKEMLARANAFLRGDEWEFARKEFLKISKFLKVKPLEKIYDRWSEDLRNEIIFKYNEEIKKFKIECMRKKDFKTFYKLRIFKNI